MKTNSRKTPAGPVDGAAEVDALMAKLDHPRQAEIAEVRGFILGASPEIGEAVKWNAPSFRTHEFFATCNLRARDRVELIFHLGAKARKPAPEMKIADPAGLLKWLAKDRCLVTVGAGAAVAANQRAFQDIVRQWIKCV